MKAIIILGIIGVCLWTINLFFFPPSHAATLTVIFMIIIDTIQRFYEEKQATFKPFFLTLREENVDYINFADFAKPKNI